MTSLGSLSVTLLLTLMLMQEASAKQAAQVFEAGDAEESDIMAETAVSEIVAPVVNTPAPIAIQGPTVSPTQPATITTQPTQIAAPTVTKLITALRPLPVMPALRPIPNLPQSAARAPVSAPSLVQSRPQVQTQPQTLPQPQVHVQAQPQPQVQAQPQPQVQPPPPPPPPKPQVQPQPRPQPAPKPPKVITKPS